MTAPAPVVVSKSSVLAPAISSARECVEEVDSNVQLLAQQRSKQLPDAGTCMRKNQSCASGALHSIPSDPTMLGRESAW